MILTYSAQPPNPRYLEAWASAKRELVARVRVPIGVVIVIDSCVHPPDEESTKAIRATITAHQMQIGAFAYVVEGKGFAAAAMRGVITFMSMAARYPFPMRTFATCVEAAPWVLSRCRDAGARHTDEQLVSAVEMMRGKVGLAKVG